MRVAFEVAVLVACFALPVSNAKEHEHNSSGSSSSNSDSSSSSSSSSSNSSHISHNRSGNGGSSKKPSDTDTTTVPTTSVLTTTTIPDSTTTVTSEPTTTTTRPDSTTTETREPTTTRTETTTRSMTSTLTTTIPSTSTRTSTFTRTSTETTTDTHTSTETETTTETHTTTSRTMTTTTQTTTTETTTTHTTTTACCFEDNSAWAPLDMPGTMATEVEDAYACQKKCASTEECKHFSFEKTLGTCHLQDAYASKNSLDTEFLSGPFECWGGIVSVLGAGQDDYVDVGNKTYLETDIACLERGILYSPIMVGGGPTYLDTSPQNGHAEAINKCQEQCSNVQDCAHFSLQIPVISGAQALCRLSTAVANPLVDVGVVSGPRGGCVSDDTEEKFDTSAGQLHMGWHRAAQGRQNFILVGACSLFTLGVFGGYSLRIFSIRNARHGTVDPLDERNALLTGEA